MFSPCRYAESRHTSSAHTNQILKRFILIIAGGNILIRKQLEKMYNDQPIDYTMKVQENVMLFPTNIKKTTQNYTIKTY